MWHTTFVKKIANSFDFGEFRQIILYKLRAFNSTLLFRLTICLGPIHHGLATPFLSHRVTLNARKTRDFIRDFHHLAIEQTRPSPPMLGFVDKVLARFNCAIFNSHITMKKTLRYVCTTTSKACVFLGNHNFASSSPLRVGSVEIIV